ncbi:MAG: tetratricopeptide repeat protein [Nitrospinae bacterium]|nr:tetratricopeptide repeat protein [Nitrospinota bacterium]
MAGKLNEDKDFQAANEAFEKGRFAEAMELLTEAAARYPNEPEVQQRLGLCAFERATQRLRNDISTPADWRAAVEHLEAALAFGDNRKIANSLAVAHHNLGVHLNLEEAFKEAQGQFHRALSINPEMTEVSVSLAVNHADQGELDTAEELLRAAVERSPDSHQARYTLALVLRAQGKDAEAVEQFKQAQSLEQDDVTLHYNRGVSYANQGNVEEAEAAFRQALELNPESVPALYNLGLILHQQGKLSQAEGCFEEVTRLDPESPGSHLCLATLYEKRDPALAIPAWERYLEVAARLPSEAETAAKVARHLTSLKKKAEEA